MAVTTGTVAKPPILIAHRGASGDRPEHTLEAYQLAIDQGADFIEPDLVLTKDGVLVARHENEISGTTDVAAKPEFAARKATKTIDGESVTGWFTEDFTLAELKTLRARERIALLRPANAAFDGQFAIPTFDEILDLLRRHEKKSGRLVGVYPETKHPSYFANIGLTHTGPLLAALKRHGYRSAKDPVFIQSFEVGNLIDIDKQAPFRLIQLMSIAGGPFDKRAEGVRYADMLSSTALKAVARYADGIGVEKGLLVSMTADGILSGPTNVAKKAARAGLVVHAWTFRAENYFLPSHWRSSETPGAHGDMVAEINYFISAGVDGIFSDNVAEARAALDAAK